VSAFADAAFHFPFKIQKDILVGHFCFVQSEQNEFVHYRRTANKRKRRRKFHLDFWNQRRNNPDVSRPTVICLIYGFHKTDVSSVRPSIQFGLKKPLGHTFCAQKDCDFAVIISVIENVINEGPLWNQSDPAAYEDKVPAFGFFYWISAIAVRAADTDFVAGP
jgi:hypothetical protein